MEENNSNKWDAGDYDDDVDFVYEYGESVVDLLDPKPGQRVLDLGCGTGHLTARINDEVKPKGTIIGLDGAPDMITAARTSYPDITFIQADARKFSVAEMDVDAFDAVFSNAMLHWIPRSDQTAVAQRVANVLAPGGEFVAELGGIGNVEMLVNTTQEVLREHGYERDHPWYFPTLGDHATLLEGNGFEVNFARLFDRPTTLEGESGLRDWLDVFGDSLFAGLTDECRESVITCIEDRLREDIYDPESDTWTADYRRLRFRAVRNDD
jgi:trans-aconitate methyltransferase